MSTSVLQSMAWSNEKVRLTCVENISFKHLWKLVVLDNKAKNNSKNSEAIKIATSNLKKIGSINNNNSCENLMNFFTNRDISEPSKMSLLKFLAINALDLSAPAAPVLLERQQQRCNKPEGWMQLSGHPETIIPTAAGIVRKKVTSPQDSEIRAYAAIKCDPHAKKLVPKYLGLLEHNGELYIELQDLLYGFKDPNVMDIKLGSRTFLESEVSNTKLRPDLYEKMIAIDPTAPTEEEHELQAITKLRYMLFREQMSSSFSKGFRIEALRQRGQKPIKDLKKVQTTEQINETMIKFVNGRKDVTEKLIYRLTNMRSLLDQSEFVATHEIIGSSIFIVYDDNKVGAWLIDFAKSSKLPEGVKINHRSEWKPDNREDGFLRGMDELINAFHEILN